MRVKPSTRARPLTLVASLCVLLTADAALAAPLTLLGQWEGGMDYFATGAPLAVDGPDADTTTVDTLSQPASVQVGPADVPPTAQVVAAYLYWAGTITDQDDCGTTQHTDDEVMLTLPGAASAAAILADQCLCIAGATSYDIQACRKEITALVAASGMQGTFTVDEFAARAMNGATDNASFSLVLVFEEADLLPPRRIALYDGLEELYEGSVNMQLGGIEVDNPAQGEITWYVLDGDVGGVGPEEVRVMGLPGGVSAAVGDMYNPVDNPMNRTINTTVPPQMGVIGVDIDRLDISAALTPLDTALDMTYTAGGDKYWVVYNLVGVNVFRPVVHPKLSSKSWVMQLDADGSGSVTEGDTVRYTIHLENVGTAPGYVTIRDPIPAEFSSWQLVDGAGGVDLSTATELVLENLWLAVGGSADLLLDAVIGPGAAGSTVVNVATWEVESSGAQGSLEGSVLTVTTGSEPDAGLWDSSVPDAQADGGEVLDSGPDSQPGRDVASQTDSQPPSGTAPVGCGCQGVAGPSPGGAFLLVALVLLCLLLQGRSREASRGPLGRLSRLGRGD